MVNDLLKQLGFGEKEITVYLTLLQHGKLTPASLAKIVKLNRTTVYAVAKELTQKGVIAEDLGGASMFLVAKPAQDLVLLAEKEEKHLQEKKSIIKNAIEELQTIAKPTQYTVPKIVFVAQDQVNDHLYKQTPAWDKSILQYDGIWWGFQDHSFVQSYESWIDWYWEKGGSTKTSLKLLSNEIAEQIKKKKFQGRQIRFWKQSHSFQATTWILGDFVVMIVTNQKPHYLVEIHDKVLAHDMREVFKGIWNTQIEK